MSKHFANPFKLLQKHCRYDKKRKGFYDEEIASDQQSGYVTECFYVGSVITCKNLPDLKFAIASTCAKEDNTIARIIRSHKNRFDWVCYFSVPHKNEKFPHLAPSSLCPFTMNWVPRNKNENYLEYYCRKMVPNHNHPRLTTSNLQEIPRSVCLSNDIKVYALTLYQEGFTPKRIYEKIVEKHPDIMFNYRKIKDFVKYECQKKKMAMTYEDIIKNHIKTPDTIIESEPKTERFFATTTEKIYIWNNMKDIMFISTSYNIYSYFNFTILMVTVDSWGNNNLIALTLARIGNELSYSWAFKKFKKLGLVDPEIIVMDSEPVLYNCLKKCFPQTKILFSVLHVLERLHGIFSNDWTIIREKMIGIYKAESEPEIIKKFSEMVDEIPVTARNNELENLMIKRKKWTKYWTCNYFLAGLHSKRRIRNVEVLLKAINSLLKKEAKFNIFKEFEDMQTSNNTKISNFEKPEVVLGLKGINGLQNLYTDFCIQKILRSLNGMENCEIKSELGENFIYVEDDRHFCKEEFEIDVNAASCNCNKTIKYKIPCCHLLFTCKKIKGDLLPFIVTNTSRRWLLPQNWNKSDAEIFQMIKSMPPEIEKPKNEIFMKI
ncbi:unnamed protein product [Blepharisma stoltei]|uniref:SWIM-type domain-containing protein n=1 Tax=Blepharisma stoltei TaxID=1481888 RepID=A0AAU9JQL2_9CILI|nr:unnamed protein product [Blepharisma stoltei]